MKKNNYKHYLTLEKTVKVLNLLAKEESPQGIIDIAKQLKINASTIHRILYTLQEYSFVKQDGAKGKYSLGIRLFELGNLFFRRLNIGDNILPILKKLMADSQETVSLSVYSKGERIYLLIVRSCQPIQTIAFEGRRELLHKTASGKAIMAYLPESEIDWIIKEKGLPKYTDKTITDIDRLKDELKKIRSCGYAFDDGEGEEEIRCIAAPVFNHEGNIIYAISISTPAYRFNSKKLDIFKKLICNASKEVSNSLGYLKY